MLNGNWERAYGVARVFSKRCSQTLTGAIGNFLAVETLQGRRRA